MGSDDEFTPEELERAEARAKASAAAAAEILGILAQRMADDRKNPLFWSARSIVATLLTAAWQASQSTLWPLQPADYVALLRSHADTVEREHCPPAEGR